VSRGEIVPRGADPEFVPVVIEVPTDPRNPGDEFLQREIDDNRRSEFWRIPKAALAIVAALVVIREVFFR
jgi:anti-sigma-K factor RskA